MKLLMILFSLFTVNLNNFFDSEEINMECIYEEVENEIINYDNYVVICRDNKLDILYNDERIRLIDNVFHYEIIYENDSLTIFFSNSNNSYLNVYSFKKGKMNYYKEINNKFIDEFDVILYRDNFLFVSTISEYENEYIKSIKEEKDYLLNKNGIVILFDKNCNILNCEIYGGELNDSFTNLYFDEYNENIYITGWKDQNSGYDFGNGGNGKIGYLFVKINNKLEIENYLIFNDKIINIQIYDFNINVFTSLSLFVFDSDLNKLSSLKFEYYCIFGKQISKYWVSIFNGTELKIYDIVKNKCIDNLKYEFSENIFIIKEYEDYLYLIDNYKIYKCIFYNDIYSNRLFIYDDFKINEIDEYIIGIPRKYKLENISYEENYSPVIFGKYEVYFNYEYFIIESNIEVLERANVTNEYVYPVNYNLLFSGIGYLNDQLINNNHKIVEEGKYRLLLKGKDEDIEINFFVYDMDIFYEENDLKYWDYETRINQELIFEFHYNEKVKIIDVIVNDDSYDFINDEDNSIIYIKFINNYPGLYKYFINKIIYEKNDIKYEYNINKFIKLNVIDKKISLNNNFYNNDKYLIVNSEIINNNNKVRYLKVLFEDNSYQIIPLKAGNIIINSDKVEEAKFFIVYDVNGSLLEEKELFSIKYNFKKDNYIGVLGLNIENNELKEINLKLFENNNLKSLSVNDQIEYYLDNSNINIVIISCVIISLVCISVLIFKKAIKRK